MLFNRLDYAYIAASNKLALNVKSVLDSGQSAIEDGGVLAPLAKEVDSIGGGAYHISYKIAVYVAIIGAVLGGVGLALSNGSNRQEKKDNVKWLIIGSIICFAAAGIIAVAESVGAGMFAAAGN